jgi:hypothetical protein
MNRLKRIAKRLVEFDGQARPESTVLALAIVTSASAALLTPSSGVVTALHSVAGLLP